MCEAPSRKRERTLIPYAAPLPAGRILMAKAPAQFFPLTDAVLAAPRLVLAHPAAFAAWALVAFVQEMAYSGVILLSGSPISAFLVNLPFTAVLLAAILRAWLQPQESRAAWLRLGPEEFWVLILLALAAVVMAAVAIPVSIVAAMAAKAMGLRLMGGPALVLGSVVAGLVILRLVTAPAVAVEQGPLGLAAAWRSTRGLSWQLALLLAVVLAVERGVLSLPGLVMPVAPSAAWLDPARLAAAAWRAVFGTFGLAVTAAIIARAWRGRTLG